MIRPDRTTDGRGLDPEALRSLGLLPRAVDGGELAPAVCTTCLSLVWGHRDGTVLDVEGFRGLALLSLHPCCHDLTVDDLDDPDWGWVPDWGDPWWGPRG